MLEDKKDKNIAFLNIVLVIATITTNYLSQFLKFNNTTIGEVSAKYNSLFTPAGYAFAIWGPIFIGLLVYTIYQYKNVTSTEFKTLNGPQAGYWLALANTANCAWVFAFSYEYIGLSVLLMLVILISLIKILLVSKMQLTPVNFKTKAMVWWPIGMYAGWISVATIANIAVYFIYSNWQIWMSHETWTVIMITVAIIVFSSVVILKRVSIFGLVGIWALFAIYIKHEATLIGNAALLGVLLLGLVILAVKIKWVLSDKKHQLKR